MSFLDNSQTMEVTGKIMAITIIILFMVLLFFLFLHLYIKWYLWGTEEPPLPRHNNHHHPRRRYLFDSDHQDPVFSNGLDLSVLRSIPVLIFESKDFKEGLECAVCLSQVIQGEKARVLPKCNHGFHVGCIDMWFQSHSTCPLCRCSLSESSSSSESQEHNNVGSPPEEILPPGNLTESPNFPTNVLFWGDQNQVTATTAENCSGRIEEGASSSASSSHSSSGNGRQQVEMRIIDVLENGGEEESKSAVPTPTRLRSLKRLWSRDKRVAPGNCSSASVEA